MTTATTNTPAPPPNTVLERRPSESPTVGSSTFSTFKEKMSRALSPNRDAHAGLAGGGVGRRQSFGTGSKERSHLSSRLLRDSNPYLSNKSGKIKGPTKRRVGDSSMPCGKGFG
ncbi:hypothetical protein V865_005616 [Kwoniella europaea PYCC6329]|uniref:Uncharacterized protein n=1 Tax=Kwoniella europaea PYCC6329 TaxID=1423913 RepID=A0AAX4KPI8_9TREE